MRISEGACATLSDAAEGEGPHPGQQELGTVQLWPVPVAQRERKQDNQGSTSEENIPSKAGRRSYFLELSPVNATGWAAQLFHRAEVILRQRMCWVTSLLLGRGVSPAPQLSPWQPHCPHCPLLREPWRMQLPTNDPEMLGLDKLGEIFILHILVFLCSCA